MDQEQEKLDQMLDILEDSWQQYSHFPNHHSEQQGLVKVDNFLKVINLTIRASLAPRYTLFLTAIAEGGP